MTPTHQPTLNSHERETTKIVIESLETHNSSKTSIIKNTAPVTGDVKQKGKLVKGLQIVEDTRSRGGDTALGENSTVSRQAIELENELRGIIK